jgi:hypothetical protein
MVQLFKQDENTTQLNQHQLSASGVTGEKCWNDRGNAVPTNATKSQQNVGPDVFLVSPGLYTLILAYIAFTHYASYLSWNQFIMNALINTSLHKAAVPLQRVFIFFFFIFSCFYSKRTWGADNPTAYNFAWKSRSDRNFPLACQVGIPIRILSWSECHPWNQTIISLFRAHDMSLRCGKARYKCYGQILIMSFIEYQNEHRELLRKSQKSPRISHNYIWKTQKFWWYWKR